MAQAKKRYVGLVMDVNFPRKAWAGNIIQHLSEGSVVVTTTADAHHYIQRAVLQKGTVHLKLFDLDPWSKGPRGKRARDSLFLSYLEVWKGELLIFPTPYDPGYGQAYSDRVQDLIIMAHQRGIAYEVIAKEQ